LQFDVIMLDVAAPDPDGDPGTLNSIPAQFLSPGFIQEGLRSRLRYMRLVAFSSVAFSSFLACMTWSTSASGYVAAFFALSSCSYILMTTRVISKAEYSSAVLSTCFLSLSCREIKKEALCCSQVLRAQSEQIQFYGLHHQPASFLEKVSSATHSQG